MQTETASTLPLILSLETATLGGSVFLGRGKVELAIRNGDPQISHSNSLLRDINDSLEEAGITLQQVDLFACASGPGSFTGLRIGIATLKALATTLDRPCVGIPTLEAVAHATIPQVLSSAAGGTGPALSIVALLPAGRGEVFAQMFSVSDEGVIREMDSAAHLSPEKLVDRYGAISELTWAGSGAHLQRKVIADYAQQHGIAFTDELVSEFAKHERRWALAPPESNLAAHVAALALQRFERGVLQSPQTLGAIYVRRSDAELKEECR